MVVLLTIATMRGFRECLYSWFTQKGFRVEGGFANSFAIAAPLETLIALVLDCLCRSQRVKAARGPSRMMLSYH